MIAVVTSDILPAEVIDHDMHDVGLQLGRVSGN